MVHTRRFTRGDRGFTILELAALIIIVAVLTAIGYPMFVSHRDEAKNAWVLQSVYTLQVGVQSYALDHGGAYPTTLGIATLIDSSGKAYVKEWPRNPWTLAPMSDSGGTYREGDYHYSRPTRTSDQIVGYLSSRADDYTLPRASP